MTWLVVGAAHLDFVAEVDSGSLQTDEDAQSWVQWSTEVGGVAANLARYLDQLGEPAIFLAVVGNDDLGELIVNRAREELGNISIQEFRVESSPSGVVFLLHVIGSDSRSRLVLGPESTAIDVVRYTDLRSLVASAPQPRRMLLDGYLMRGRAKEWIEDIERIRLDGVEVFSSWFRTIFGKKSNSMI